MDNKMKMELFERMAHFEKLAGTKTYDNRDYFEMANGAYEMLKVLGLSKEYIAWSDGKVF